MNLTHVIFIHLCHKSTVILFRSVSQASAAKLARMAVGIYLSGDFIVFNSFKITLILKHIFKKYNLVPYFFS